MKLAVVTGGSRGIGQCIAQKFSRCGINVVTLSRTALDTDHMHIPCDVSREEQVKEAFQMITKEYKNIDVLVNAAGINKDQLLVTCGYDDIMTQLGTNLVGAMLTCKYALRSMMARRSGAIINIGSVVGERGNAGQCVYSASKAGLAGFTKSLAKEVASRNVRVNLVAPGFIATDMTRHLEGPQSERLKGAIPLGRFGEAEDVADLVFFLTQSSYITGQTMYCDGGLHLNL